MASLPEKFAYPDRVGDDLAPLTSDQLHLVGTLCQAAAHLPHRPQRGTRVRSYYYVPSPEQWAAGDRWLRCDVAVAGLGPASGPQLEPLPPTAEPITREMFGAYRRCIDTPLPADEDHTALEAWDEAETVPCEGAQWEAAPPVTLEWHRYRDATEYTVAVAHTCEGVLAAAAPRRVTVWSAEMPRWTHDGDDTAVVTCWLA